MFGALAIIYGLTLGVAEKAFDRYLPRKPTSVETDTPTPMYTPPAIAQLALALVAIAERLLISRKGLVYGKQD